MSARRPVVVRAGHQNRDSAPTDAQLVAAALQLPASSATAVARWLSTDSDQPVDTSSVDLVCRGASCKRRVTRITTVDDL
jgi:NADH:ubiquinone oxidoreductase subunit E